MPTPLSKIGRNQSLLIAVALIAIGVGQAIVGTNALESGFPNGIPLAVTIVHWAMVVAFGVVALMLLVNAARKS